MKIVAACGSGIGSSLMVSMKISEILKKLSITADVSHCDLSSIGFTEADIFVFSRELADSVVVQRLEQNKIILLSNILDGATLETKLKEKIEFLNLK